MKFTGIAAFFAAMTAVTAAPLGVAADVGQLGNEVKQGMYFPVDRGSWRLLITYQTPVTSSAV